MTALESRSGMAALRASTEEDRAGRDERSVERWSDEVVVVR